MDFYPAAGWISIEDLSETWCVHADGKPLDQFRQAGMSEIFVCCTSSTRFYTTSKTICITVKHPDADGNPQFKDLKLWKWDPVAVVQEILENPDLKDDIHYKPMRSYTDEEKSERIYNEMWTGDWWNEKAISRKSCL